MLTDERATPSTNLKHTDQALAAIRKEMVAAAKAHRVEIDADRTSYVSGSGLTIVQAPLAGIEGYGDADFEAGAPIHLLIVRSGIRNDVPDGSYVVKAQFGPRAASGRAIFMDRGGAAVAERELLVRTREQAEVLFPRIYPPSSDPQFIPVITSTHQWAYVGNGWKWAVDCAGWDPYRVLYY
jgi:hypothetical protein